VITDRVRECRDFYGRWFELSVIFEASWIVVLSSDGEAPAVAFMHPEHPSTPPEPAPRGRRFAAIDPAGTWIDVVEQTEPAEGWWDRYL
jgi:hypothetical protein